ncbi:Hypothetical protein NTJ_08268 [Nesidiocoris tenuis]|uniref:Uncharacterized protein n=1 Tax=Nesidiocoris tenuis TaxID=355587 RepID=A0ABN7AVX6_9HEMI|nr:Hypothetical protein NTJ_08268 [Nesidiocoris tenuis]
MVTNMSAAVLCILSAVQMVLGEAPYPGASPDLISNQVAPGGSAPYPGAPPVAPAPQPAYTKWEQDNDNTISLQSGYEGYLIPAEPSLSFTDILRTAGLITVAPPLGKLGLKFALKFGVWFAGLAALFLLGSLVTSTVCTLTPICTISFLGLGPFSKETVRSYISDDRLNSATNFVFEAINKYKSLNRKSDDSKSQK